jgi:cyclopropane fatty-acyl-phospholipid synthase-like methyltransferase
LNLLVKLIDELAGRIKHGAQILSIASGHVREAHLAAAVRGGRISRFVALDQDEATMKVVATELHRYGVETVTEQVRAVILGKCIPGTFDLIYSVGLSDYLPTRVTERLISRMFAMLNPGGQLVIPNFLPNILDSGFMESFMDWHLIYRDAADMSALARNLPKEEIAGKRTFSDPTNNIVFLQITKTAG